MRKLQTQTSYWFNRKNGAYLVTLQRLKNSASGAQRYKAYITGLFKLSFEAIMNDYGVAHSHVRTFTGHYDTEVNEANFILDQFLKEEQE